MLNWMPQALSPLPLVLAAVLVLIVVAVWMSAKRQSAAPLRPAARQQAGENFSTELLPKTAEPATALHPQKSSFAVPLSMMDRSSLSAGQDTAETQIDPPGPDHGCASVTAPSAVPGPVSSPAATVSGIGLLLERHGGAEEPAAQCMTLLALAKSHLQSGAPTAAAAVLRDAIRLAAANDLADHHASARLELGELARQDGDLITACEHWQIARGLFDGLKNGARVKIVETRMREHGCPTDWVLNDF